jgi:superfamily II DNA/RNA helicase
LIELAESLLHDKKREALESLLGRLQRETLPERPPICIFCSAKATASYLQPILIERGYKPWLLVGNQTSEELQASLNGFRNEGGILVCSSIALKGVDLPGVLTFIHYDPPGSDLEMWVRVTRNPDATHYLLKDESGILPEEWAVPDLTKAMPKQRS